MIPKSGSGFRKRSCSTNKLERDDESKLGHHALVAATRHPGSSDVSSRYEKPHTVDLDSPCRILYLAKWDRSNCACRGEGCGGLARLPPRHRRGLLIMGAPF